MKEILETTQLEFDKSAFLIDLVKHDSGNLYIEIVQTIHNENSGKQSIKINPEILTDILRVLQNYHAKLTSENIIDVKHLTESDQQKIQDRYLRGVSLKELALQLDQSEELIEMVLRNKGIRIVANEMPKSKFWRRRKR